jgi:hypothetical protein
METVTVTSSDVGVLVSAMKPATAVIYMVVVRLKRHTHSVTKSSGLLMLLIRDVATKKFVRTADSLPVVRELAPVTISRITAVVDSLPAVTVVDWQCSLYTVTLERRSTCLNIG